MSEVITIQLVSLDGEDPRSMDVSSSIKLQELKSKVIEIISDLELSVCFSSLSIFLAYFFIFRTLFFYHLFYH